MCFIPMRYMEELFYKESFAEGTDGEGEEGEIGEFGLLLQRLAAAERRRDQLEDATYGTFGSASDDEDGKIETDCGADGLCSAETVCA